MHAVRGVFRAEQGDAVDLPEERRLRGGQAGGVAGEGQVRAELAPLHFELMLTERLAQRLDQVEQRLRRAARREMEDAVAPAAEMVELQVERLAWQGLAQLQQLRLAAARHRAEEGQGHVQVGRRYRVAIRADALAPGMEQGGQVLRAGQGEEQSQGRRGHGRVPAVRSVDSIARASLGCRTAPI
ncbi:hypothetical protein D3C80_1482960 [compost metagenome]